MENEEQKPEDVVVDEAAPVAEAKTTTPETLAVEEAKEPTAEERAEAEDAARGITRARRKDGSVLTLHAAVPTGHIVSTPHKPKPMPRVRPGSPPVAANPALGNRVSRAFRARQG